MQKYVSKVIPIEDIKIDLSRYWDENEKRVETVRLTMISTGIQITVSSYIGQLHAYNSALKKIEEELLEGK